MEEENIILQFISSWFWHIVGVIFLVGAFNIFFSGKELGNTVFFIVFVAMWGLCEIISYKRRSKIKAYNNNNE